jgi:hypothetical protein
MLGGVTQGSQIQWHLWGRHLSSTEADACSFGLPRCLHLLNQAAFSLFIFRLYAPAGGNSPCVCSKPRPALLLHLQLLPQPVDLPLLCQHLKVEVLHLASQARPLHLKLLQQRGALLIVPAVLLIVGGLEGTAAAAAAAAAAGAG